MALEIKRGDRVRQPTKVAHRLGHRPRRYKVVRVLKDGRVSLWGPVGCVEASQFWTTMERLEKAGYDKPRRRKR